MLGPIADGETVIVTTRLTGYRKALARRETAVVGPDDDLRALVVIDWAMTDGRAAVRIPAEFERVPLDGPGPFTPVRVDLPPNPPGARTFHLSPRLRELDPMNHANTGVYLDWLDEAVAAAGDEGTAATAALPRTYRLHYLRRPDPGPRCTPPPGATEPAGPIDWPAPSETTSSGDASTAAEGNPYEWATAPAATMRGQWRQRHQRPGLRGDDRASDTRRWRTAGEWVLQRPAWRRLDTTSQGAVRALAPRIEIREAILARLWIVFLAGGLVPLAAYFTVLDRGGQDLVYNLFGLGSTAAIFLGILLWRPAPPGRLADDRRRRRPRVRR